MKFLIASDIHGSSLYCRQLLSRYQQEKADKLLLLGDLLYHGPRNKLPEEYSPQEVISMLNSLKSNITAFVETVIRKLIKWFWNFQFSRIMQSSQTVHP